jgi:Domain of unknown function (DUF6487)
MTVEVLTCPNCGAPTEEGTLGAMTYVGGVKWYRERSTLALGGETLQSKPLGGMVWLDGQRCPNCRLLLLHY